MRRLAGVAVVLSTLGLAAAILVIIALANPRPFWDPADAEVFGFDVRYDAHAPALWIIVAAIAIALAAGLGVAVLVSRAAGRARRADPEQTRRPLAPRRVMALTRGRFAGEVTITALIPAHNEEDCIAATLESLGRQTTPPDRIVVVADNCTDRTVEIARAAGVEVWETVGNTAKKAGALNQALSRILPGQGDNDTVLVMDADTELSGERFLETARRRMSSDRALMAVGGLFHGEQGPGLLRQFQRNEYTRYAREIERRRGKVFVLSGTASVFRPAALRAVAEARGSALPGLPGDVYDTVALTEDNEITIAIKTLGGLIVSPGECTVTTELMPSWRMLWKQRLRWQRGALENLSAYGVTPTTARYWSQQIGIGYSVIALTAYLTLLVVFALSIDEWVWFTFWLVIGLVFVAERVITVWQGGWKARILAALVLPELIYDLFIDVVFVKGVIDMAFGRSATWSHLGTEATT